MGVNGPLVASAPEAERTVNERTVNERTVNERTVNERIVAERIVARSGAVAALVRTDAGEQLTVRDSAGRLLFELRDGDTQGAVVVHHGDLELRAEGGRVRIVGAHGIELEGPVVSVRAQHLRQVVGILETTARRILEKATDAYREVEGVSQTRAQHVRVLARETVRTFAKRLRMKASKDVKVDGEKIYLG